MNPMKTLVIQHIPGSQGGPAWAAEKQFQILSARQLRCRKTSESLEPTDVGSGLSFLWLVVECELADQFTGDCADVKRCRVRTLT